MNRKGLTLVEIIAVVAVLAVILLVSFPAYNGLIKSNTRKKYDDFIETLCEAGQYYFLHEDISLFNSLNSTGQITIKLQLLKNKNLLKGNLINPKTNAAVNLNSNLVIKKQSDGTYKCELN